MDWAELSMLERLHVIVQNADRIFVRAQIDGKWQSVSLVELPDHMLMVELRRLAKRDVQPVMLKGDLP